MSLVAGTDTRYNKASSGIKESLDEVISNISPEETPFRSSIGRKGIDQTLHEWLIDELSAVDGDNAFIEGDEASYATPAPAVRVGNLTQISGKTARVSRTVDKIRKAGRKSEMAYEIAKRGRELKRDQETILLANQAANAGSTSLARRLAGLGAWIKTNVDMGATGGNPTYTSGVPSAARTDATSGDLRAFTETIAKAVIASMWAEGGEPNVLMVGSFNKQVVSTGFAGIAARNFDLSNVKPKATAVIASVDVYVGDLATVRVVPNRFQRGRDAWFLDFDLLALGVFDPIMDNELAKTGDAKSRMLVTEYTLVVKNEAGLGLAADLTSA